MLFFKHTYQPFIEIAPIASTNKRSKLVLLMQAKCDKGISFEIEVEVSDKINCISKASHFDIGLHVSITVFLSVFISFS